jgi:hypothetical protein
MHNPKKKNDSSQKSLFVTLMAWGVLIIYSAASVYGINSAFKDLAILKNNDISSFFIFLMATFIFIIVLIPLIFAIGLLIRKNWGRLGIMTISLLSVAMNFSYFAIWKAFYPQQLLWVLFSLSLFMMLKSERIKREFILP